MTTHEDLLRDNKSRREIDWDRVLAKRDAEIERLHDLVAGLERAMAAGVEAQRQAQSEIQELRTRLCTVLSDEEELSP